MYEHSSWLHSSEEGGTPWKWSYKWASTWVLVTESESSKAALLNSLSSPQGSFLKFRYTLFIKETLYSSALLISCCYAVGNLEQNEQLLSPLSVRITLQNKAAGARWPAAAPTTAHWSGWLPAPSNAASGVQAPCGRAALPQLLPASDGHKCLILLRIVKDTSSSRQC